MSDGGTNDMNPAPDELDQAAAAFADAAGAGGFTQMAELQAMKDRFEVKLV